VGGPPDSAGNTCSSHRRLRRLMRPIRRCRRTSCLRRFHSPYRWDSRSRLCSTLSFATSNWLTPETNQAYRIEVSGRSDVLKGANELTFVELTRAIDVIKRGGVADRPFLLSNQPLREMTLVVHGRIALSAAAILLAVFALTIARLSAAVRLGSAALVCGVYLWFYGYLDSPSETFSALPALAVAWIPNMFVALLVAILRIAPSISPRTA
jgi:hypothetical protein